MKLDFSADKLISMGITVLKAVIILVAGHYLTLFLIKLMKKSLKKLNIDISLESFNRFLIISLDVLICRYSPLFRAFPALFISEEPHKSFYYPSCFRSQK